ncbi:hypothetical protein ACFLYO_02515 [Chloroflexota bacterium]
MKLGNTKQDGWIQHTLQNAPWRRQSQLAAILALVLIVSIIIGALYLAQVTAVATTGRQNEEHQRYRDTLVRDSEQIRADIAELRSIPRLLRRAQELGFTYADRGAIEYLIVAGYLPAQPESVAPLEPEGDTLPLYDETFSGWLQQQWQGLVEQFEAWAGPAGG